MALGTAVGSILLYSTVKGELHSKLTVSRYVSISRKRYKKETQDCKNSLKMKI